MTKPRPENRTVTALMGRGVDLALARELVTAGYTLATLKQKDKASLEGLGLPDSTIETILSESRPPIPDEALVQALYHARNVCCICRDATKSVIVHHIHPWHESHSHDPENLAVLCLYHHDEAHTKHELSLSLTPERIREFRRRWLQEVRERDVEAITRGADFFSPPVLWDYFNHSRIADLVNSDSPLKGLHSRNLVPPTGSADQFWMYAGDLGVMLTRRRFYSGVMVDIMRGNGFISLNAMHGNTAAALVCGGMVSLKAMYQFSSVPNAPQKGPGQIRKVTTNFCGVTFRFTIDAWEATCASAWSSHLNDAGMELLAVLLIRSISGAENKKIVVQATCLAIGMGSAGMNWTPPRTALPLVGVAAGPEPVYCCDKPSTCQRCGAPFGVVMYDAIIGGAGGYFCQRCFSAGGCKIFHRYERTFEPEFEWVLVGRSGEPSVDL